MKEYEYSFEVDSLSQYIDYCENNNYSLVSSNNETRNLYTSDNGVLARLTKKDDSIILDFKEENDSNNILKERKESIPLEVKESDLDKINSILDILGYKMIKHLVRSRRVYKKENVKFELDDYTSPTISHVVAIEGKKEDVDKVYLELQELIK